MHYALIPGENFFFESTASLNTTRRLLYKCGRFKIKSLKMSLNRLIQNSIRLLLKI